MKRKTKTPSKPESEPVRDIVIKDTHTGEPINTPYCTLARRRLRRFSNRNFVYGQFYRYNGACPGMY